MNTRFMCSNCGHQPCLCQEFECPTCGGRGEVDRLHLRPQMIECDTCKGEGTVKCDGPTTKSLKCPWEADEMGGFCRCERAWDDQQERNASEPPPSARERQMRDYEERQALRSGRPYP
jgi:hypothetical protein